MEIQHYTESTPESLTKIVEGWTKKHSPSFDELTASVLQTHQTAQASAIRAVNQMATLRNWLIGCYIVEYEQKGRDRAKYGDRLLKRLEEKVDTKGLNVTLFRNSRSFYKLYPQMASLFRISVTASHKLFSSIHPTSSDEFTESSNLPIHPMPSDEFITPPQNISSRLCPRWNGQPTLCLYLYASVARQEYARKVLVR